MKLGCYVRSLGLVATLGATSLLGTSCVESVDDPTEELSADVLDATPRAVGGRYYLYIDPSTNTIKVSTEPFSLEKERQASTSSSPSDLLAGAGHLVPNQFAEVIYVQDGANGTNPPRTFEIQGGAASLNNAAQSGGQTQCPGQNLLIDITVRHFFEFASLEDVYVEFTNIEPGPSHYPYDTDPVGALPLDDSIGVYSYGTLDNSNSNAASRTWKFERCTNEAFTLEFVFYGTCVPEAGRSAIEACADNPGFSRLKATRGNSCIVRDNRIQCWGENAAGQLTDGTTADSSSPGYIREEVDGAVSGPRQVALGSFHGCAAMRDNTAQCWGRNQSGQIGDGSTINQPTPVSVKNSAGGAALTNVREVAVGQEHSCAMLTDGRVKCWSSTNQYGQSGDGTTSSRPYPVFVKSPDGTTDLTGVKKLAANSWTTCALLTSNEVVCWGLGSQGQLGNGSRGVSSLPVPVQTAAGVNLTGVTSIDVGFIHSCASTAGGAAYCWGDNGYRQIGDGSTSDQSYATQVKSIDGTTTLLDVAQIAAGRLHSCARLNSGEARCWGTGRRLGDNTTATSSLPVVVADGAGGALTGVTSISAYEEETCVNTATGELRCWGLNSYGELGDGTTTARLAPVTVLDSAGTAPLGGVESVHTGGRVSCASIAGDLLCWGGNSFGQLGTGTTSTTPSTLPVMTLLQTSETILPELNVLASAGGEEHHCFITMDQRVKCWSQINQYGEAGNGTMAPTPYPTYVKTPDGSADLSGVVQLSSNGWTNCAVLDSTEIVCWGLGTQGQLGNNTRAISSLPVFVQLGSGNLTGVRQVNVGLLHACAVSEFNNVYCWGDNRFFQLGDGTSSDRLIPVLVKDVGGAGALGDIYKVEAGRLHSCALKMSGQVVCWGDGLSLGTGSTTDSSSPLFVKGIGGSGTLTGVLNLSTYGQATSALLSNGEAVSWGLNSSGQLGDGTTSLRLTPVAIQDESGGTNLSEIQEVAMGETHACALMADRSIMCWGNNASGQLGDGTFNNSLLPTPVFGIQ